MVDFITSFCVSRVNSNYYLGATELDGDNSDNGHYIFDLKKGTYAKAKQ
jgi:hypothetical protein